jgi:hypothetical protein
VGIACYEALRQIGRERSEPGIIPSDA